MASKKQSAFTAMAAFADAMEVPILDKTVAAASQNQFFTITQLNAKIVAESITLANDGNNRIVTADGSGGLNGEANATFDGTSLVVTGEGDFISNGVDNTSANLDSYDLFCGTAFGSAVHRFGGVTLMSLFRAEGSEGSEGFLSTNDVIGRFDARPWNGADYNANSTGYLQMVANENQAANDQGTRLEFAVTANLATSAAVRMTLEANGDLELTSGNFTLTNGVMFIKEQAAADGDTAGFGQLWVKNDAPNKLFFTDDAGTDHEIAFV